MSSNHCRRARTSRLTKKQLLDQINRVFLQAVPHERALDSIADCVGDIEAKLRQRAHFPAQKKKKKKGKGGKGRGKGGDDDVVVNEEAAESSGDEVNWTDNLSKNLARLAANVNRDLLHKTILPYFTEWCETEKSASESFCMRDACLKFFNDHPPYIREVQQSPDNNCYCLLPHWFRGDVPKAVSDKMASFYSQTFWEMLQLYVSRMQCCY